MAHGWYFLPNSILLKATVLTPATGDFARESALKALLRSPHLLVLMLGALVLLAMEFRTGRRWSWAQVALGLFLGTSVSHLLLARIGWLFRYEAYLVFVGVIAVAVGASEIRARLWPTEGSRVWHALMTTAAVLLALPLTERATTALTRTPRASKNIHDQQFQMARFLARYYPGASVAANDIGAITDLAEIDLLDLFGLADLEVARRKLHGRYRTEDIHELARDRNVRVAVVYDEWFEKLGGVPPEWVRAGEWTISHNVVCGSSRVVWYAVGPGEAETLIQRLRAFSADLPPDVRQAGAYREP
jgi:hypothetical protein